MNSIFNLLKQNFRHIIRTRLIFFLLGFSFLVHYLGLKTTHSATVYFSGVVSKIGEDEGLFIALFLELFVGAFISAVYGIWMVPYLHQGQRGQLTFTFPVSKWKYPLAYGLSMMGLLVVQHGVMLITYGMVFGYSRFFDGLFPWDSVLVCLSMETLAFETVMFGFALSSMLFGQIKTFFIGAICFFSLQMAAIVFRLNLIRFIELKSTFFHYSHWVYEKLPPLGELVFSLREQFKEPSWNSTHFFLWMVWLAAFVLLFRAKLGYPPLQRGLDA